MAKDIYIKLTKEWGGFQVGDIVRFGYSKGQARIAAGEGVEVSKQPALNDPKPSKRPKAETATAKPAAEKAIAEPEIAEKDKVSEKKVKTSKEKK